MKHSALLLCCVLVACLASGSAEGIEESACTDNHLYYVRIGMPTGTTKDFSCNGLTVPTLMRRNFLQSLLEQLQAGDLVVVEADSSAIPNSLREELQKAFKAYKDRHVALRFIKGPPKTEEIFWWASPYELPRHHEATTYYWNHLKLGQGNAGFDRALEILGSSKDRKDVYFSIAEYIPAGYAFEEVPYRDRQRELDDQLKLMGVKFHRLKIAP